MSNPLVSIILTTHGEAPYLKQAIGSVLAQTYENWELIIACDGPLNVAPQPYGWGISDHRMSQPVFMVPDGVVCRFAYTINEAFKLSRGEYITYLCHDDLYLPWRLDEMVKAVEVNKFDIVFGCQQLLDEVSPDRYQFHAGPHSSNRYGVRTGDPTRPAGTVDHSSVMHRRECFEKAGGWDVDAPPRYGDAYFWIRLQRAGFQFHFIPELLDIHRFNRHSITWLEDHPMGYGELSKRDFPSGGVGMGQT